MFSQSQPNQPKIINNIFVPLLLKGSINKIFKVHVSSNPVYVKPIDEVIIIKYFKKFDNDFNGQISKKEVIDAFDQVGIDIEKDIEEIM